MPTALARRWELCPGCGNGFVEVVYRQTYPALPANGCYPKADAPAPVTEEFVVALRCPTIGCVWHRPDHRMN